MNDSPIIRLNRIMYKIDFSESGRTRVMRYEDAAEIHYWSEEYSESAIQAVLEKYQQSCAANNQSYITEVKE